MPAPAVEVPCEHRAAALVPVDAQGPPFLLQMGRTVTEISYLRSRLLDKGLISAPVRGQLSLTILGFDRFVIQQTH